MTQETREDHLVDVARQRRRRGVREHRVGTDGDGRLDPLAALRLHVAEIVCTVLVDVPVHARRLLVVFLQAVHADVALASLRVLREDKRQRNERAAVLRPAREDGDLVEIDRLLYDLLARRLLHVPREIDRLLRERQQRHDIHLVRERDVRQAQDLADLIPHIIELLDAERERHALVAAERIHEHGHVVALHVLEEQRLVPLARALRHAVRDLRDLEIAVHRLLDVAEPAALLERRDELA